MTLYKSLLALLQTVPPLLPEQLHVRIGHWLVTQGTASWKYQETMAMNTSFKRDVATQSALMPLSKRSNELSYLRPIMPAFDFREYSQEMPVGKSFLSAVNSP